MSESTDAAAGGRRGGRTVSKSTPDEVMECVLSSWSRPFRRFF